MVSMALEATLFVANTVDGYLRIRMNNNLLVPNFGLQLYQSSLPSMNPNSLS